MFRETAIRMVSVVPMHNPKEPMHVSNRRQMSGNNFIFHRSERNQSEMEAGIPVCCKSQLNGEAFGYQRMPL